MSKLINLNTISDHRGSLTVIENCLPFEIKRVYYIYSVDNSIRGQHRHHKAIQAAICISGSCKIYCNNGMNEIVYNLNEPNICLILDPIDWHKMYDFTPDAILLVLASEKYDPKDYITIPYE
jgi:dTDP-4-dehydrorhamnose 3,5-epimerase-like enzyme